MTDDARERNVLNNFKRNVKENKLIYTVKDISFQDDEIFEGKFIFTVTYHKKGIPKDKESKRWVERKTEKIYLKYENGFKVEDVVLIKREDNNTINKVL